MHVVEVVAGCGTLCIAEVQLRSLLDQITQREKELIARLVRESLKFMPTVPLPPFALFRLANLYIVGEGSDLLRVQSGSERAQAKVRLLRRSVAGMSTASDETHLWLRVVWNWARHEQRDIVFVLGRKDVVRGRQKPHIPSRNVQTSFLEHLARGTGFGRLAKVEVTARELKCACEFVRQSEPTMRRLEEGLLLTCTVGTFSDPGHELAS